MTYAEAAMPNPSSAAALAMACAVVSSCAGRSWRLDGAGLASFLVHVGAGKGGARAALDPLVTAVVAEAAEAEDILGGVTLDSARSVLAHAREVSPLVLGHLRGGDASAALRGADTHGPSYGHLRRILLDLWDASCVSGGRVGRSDFKNHHITSRSLVDPGVTVLGEADPARFLAPLPIDVLVEGHLQRFVLVRGPDVLPEANPRRVLTPPPALVARLGELVRCAHTLGRATEQVEVEVTPAARRVLNAYRSQTEQAQRDGSAHAIASHRHAYMRAVKVAGLAAVSADMYAPAVTAEAARWAVSIVQAGVEALIEAAPVERGKRQATDEQVEAMRRSLAHYITNPVPKGSGLYPDLHANRALTKATLRVKAEALGAFKRDPDGARIAVQRAVVCLIASGELIYNDKQQTWSRWGRKTESYTVGQLGRAKELR